jgi:hypothetical protein
MTRACFCLCVKIYFKWGKFSFFCIFIYLNFPLRKNEIYHEILRKIPRRMVYIKSKNEGGDLNTSLVSNCRFDYLLRRESLVVAEISCVLLHITLYPDTKAPIFYFATQVPRFMNLENNQHACKRNILIVLSTFNCTLLIRLLKQFSPIINNPKARFKLLF